MNQKSKQVLSTIQQVKLRQLQLEIAALEQQIADVLQIDNEYEVLQSSASYIRINEIEDTTVIKLI